MSKLGVLFKLTSEIDIFEEMKRSRTRVKLDLEFVKVLDNLSYL